MLAAATQRHLYIETPFRGPFVSFAPYEVPPPVGLPSIGEKGKPTWWKGTRQVFHGHGGEAGTGCFPLSLINLSAPVLINPVPRNRACAKAWLADLETLGLWQRLVPGVEPASLETRAAFVYGCVLRSLFKPLPAVTRLFPEHPSTRARTRTRVVAVHLRYGDRFIKDGQSAASRGSSCPSSSPEWQREISALARQLLDWTSLPPSRITTFRLESDDPCVRSALATELTGHPNMFVAPAIALPVHLTTSRVSSTDEAAQLAAWFAFADSDEFVFKLFCLPTGTRLSSWSSMAMLRSGRDQFHLLCADAIHESHGCHATQAPEPSVRAGPYVASCNITAANSLALGAGHTTRHAVAASTAAGQLWSMANFV